MLVNVQINGDGEIKEVLEQIDTVNSELIKLHHLLLDIQGLEIDPAPVKD